MHLDPLRQTPVSLTTDDLRQLVDFVRNGLLDEPLKPENLRKLIPARVPSGRTLQIFNFRRNEKSFDFDGES